MLGREGGRGRGADRVLVWEREREWVGESVGGRECGCGGEREWEEMREKLKKSRENALHKMGT